MDSDIELIWKNIGVRYRYWSILKERAKANGSSIPKELEKVLAKELGVK